MEAEDREGRCWQCPERPGLSLVCPSCEAPQPLPRKSDLFAVLGLPRALSIDPEDLERRYHEMSRRIHPDRHQAAGRHSHELSLVASATVNRAYRTLRDPVARGRYWLELQQRSLGDDSRVPPDLVTFVFDTQEKLEALAADRTLRAEVEAVRDDLQGRLDGLKNRLRARYVEWDASGATNSGALDELHDLLARISYLGTLLDDVEAALGG